MLLVFGLVAIAFVGVLGGGRRRSARHIALAAIVLVWLASLPVVNWGLLRALGTATPYVPGQNDGAQAIVAIAGGTRTEAPEYGGPVPGRLTADRIRYAAYLAKRTNLPVLVSGGKVKGTGTTEASLMARGLAEGHGVSARWVEDRSANTRANAVESARILAPEGVRRVILVAHSFDMPRAAREFRAVGFEIVEAPIGVPGEMDLVLADFLPHMVALEEVNWLIYEGLARVANAFRPAGESPETWRAKAVR